MVSIADSITYILIFGLTPLVYCVLCFRWFISLSTSMGIVKSISIVCVLSGISFPVFQIGQSFLVVAWSYINYKGLSSSDFPHLRNDVYDLVLDRGLLYSWTGVTHAFFPGSFIDNWEYQHLWQVELVYIVFYMVIGMAIVAGIKLWKRPPAINYIGLLILIICFVAYTFGVYFWMATAMYL